MSYGIRRLHSHSAIERDLRFRKSEVLIDVEYGDMFGDALLRPFSYHGIDYYIVNTYVFYKKGGVFMDLHK